MPSQNKTVLLNNETKYDIGCKNGSNQSLAYVDQKGPDKCLNKKCKITKNEPLP